MKQKLDSLDAVRAIMCLAVLSYHTYLTFLGQLGLSVFFIMSGFLSAYNYYDRLEGARLGAVGSFKFAARRMAKLYPLHILMMLVPAAMQLYGVVHGLLPVKSLIGRIAANVLLIQAWIPDSTYYYSLNGTTWYLSAMLFCYFMLPVIVRAMRRYRSTRTAWLVIGAAFILQLASGEGALRIYTAIAAPDEYLQGEFAHWFTRIFPIYRLGDFVAGCNLAYIFLNRAPRAENVRAATAAECAAWLLIIASEIFFEREQCAIYLSPATIFMPATLLLIYTFALGEGRVSAALTNRFTRYVSARSADVYLIQAVVIMVVSVFVERLHVSGLIMRLTYVICAVALTFLLAEASCRVRAIMAARRSARRVREG